MADEITLTSTRNGVTYGTVSAAGTSPTVIYDINGPILQLAATLGLDSSAYLQVALTYLDPTLHPTQYFELGEVNGVDDTVDQVTFKYDETGTSRTINIAMPDVPYNGTAKLKLTVTGDGSEAAETLDFYARFVAKQNVV